MEIQDISPEVGKLVEGTFLPKMFRVEQIFPRPFISADKIPNVVKEQLQREIIKKEIKPGMRIAITVGSRGIANIALITKCIVEFVKEKGAIPFIVPAMGSHGGATAEGQRKIIEGYGVTEENMGCRIISSMEVTKVGTNSEGKDVFIDRYAYEADGIIINCRIKPHTSFRGTYESGIMKMMAIGLGKQYGAEACHEAGFKNMAKNVYLFGKTILENAPVLFALATIENAYDETAEILAVHASEVEEQEPLCLKRAFLNMPRILVDACDVLVVDKIGKNYSGDGMDPNITGTFCTPYATGGIASQRVAVLDLSDETHGNAMGLGLSSVTTERVIKKLDLSAMYMNAITATVLLGVRIPMIARSDKEALQICVKSCNEIDKKYPKIVRISNTLEMSHIWLSEAYYEEVKQINGIKIESEPEEFCFDENGNLW